MEATTPGGPTIDNSPNACGGSVPTSAGAVAAAAAEQIQHLKAEHERAAAAQAEYAGVIMSERMAALDAQEKMYEGKEEATGSNRPHFVRSTCAFFFWQ